MDQDQANALRKPFDPKAVGKIPKGGAMLDYVGHASVTDRLLQVDPDWNWEPMAYDMAGLPQLDASHNLWIKLTVCGVTRIGVGDGKSLKELIGDAIRNAAMRFGVALDLWSKEELEGSGGPVFKATTAEPAIPAATRTMSRKPTVNPAKDEPAPEPDDGWLPPSDTQAKELSHKPKSITKNQQARLHILFGECGITGRDSGLGYLTNLLARSVDTTTSLSEVDAAKAIDALVADRKAS